MPALAAPGVAIRLAVVAILATLAGWLTTGSLQQDFAAYYTAGAAAARGLDPYVNYLPTAAGPWDGIAVYRHSRFLYPPLVAQLLRPLAWGPFAWAKAVFTAGSVLALVVAMGIVVRDIRAAAQIDMDKDIDATAPRRGRWLKAAATLAPLLCAVWLPVWLAIERGQMDLLLLPVLAAAWHWRERPFIAGALLASAVLFKPMVLGVVPLLLCARRFRWAAATVAGLAVLVAANAAVSGGDLFGKYLREVLPRAAAYGEGGPDAMLLPEADLGRAGDDLGQGIARSDGVGRPYFQEIGTFRRNASLSRGLAHDEPSAAIVVVTFLLLVAPLAFGAWNSPVQPGWYWGGLVAAVLAAPVSWAMGLVWAIPLVFLALEGGHNRRRSPTVRVLVAIMFVAAMIGPVFSLAWIVSGTAAVAAAAAMTVKGLKRPPGLEGPEVIP